jgi:hypothetical protein
VANRRCADVDDGGRAAVWRSQGTLKTEVAWTKVWRMAGAVGADDVEELGEAPAAEEVVA